MTATHAFELMNAEIDGAAGAQERAELDRLLEQDASLRDEFERLQRVSRLLAQMPAMEPPAGLAKSIMSKMAPPDNFSRASRQLSALSVSRNAACMVRLRQVVG